MASPIAMRTIPPPVPLPEGTICIGTEGNVGIWSPALLRWGDIGTARGSRLRSLGRNQYGQIASVGADGNVRTFYDGDWGNPYAMGNWPLNMLARRYDGTVWGVGTQGKVGMWGTDRWYDQPNGGWTLKMLTWNAGVQLVCVGTLGNVGIWNGTGWSDQGLIGGWTLKMLAFDKEGRQWGVGTLGNVGLWNGQGWTDWGTPGGWTLDWLSFT